MGALPAVFTPARLGPVTLRNRVIKAATFEGMAPGAEPSDRLVAFHRRVAAGGAAMTTVAYCAVAPEGRTYADQIWMRPEILPGLRRLTDAVHAEGAAAAVQLGHAGSFANPKATGQRPVAPSRAFNSYALAFARALDADGLARLREAFAAGARLAVEAGFDVLEVHLGHGYLLSQFLSPASNKRRDGYGGDVAGRARFPREVLRAVREAAPGVAVMAKLNMLDGFRGGLTLDDGIEVARMLEADGTVDALELTGGFTSRNPMFLMRGEVTFRELAELEQDRFRRFALKTIAPKVVRPYAFEEAFFLPQARQVRAAVGLPLILLGGITRLDTMRQATEQEGFEFVAMARALLREPDLVARLEAGATEAGSCIPCNRCVVEMQRAGTRCVFDDRSV